MNPDSPTFAADAARLFADAQRKTPSFGTRKNQRPTFGYNVDSPPRSKLSEFDLEEVRAILRDIRWSAGNFDKAEWIAAMIVHPNWRAMEKMAPAVSAACHHNYQLALVLHGVLPKRSIVDQRYQRDCYVPLPPPQPYGAWDFDASKFAPVKKLYAHPTHFCAVCKKTTRQRNAHIHKKCWERVFP